ncbi:type II toxin-antitoxin system HicB family antitoxin [Megasphaera sp. WILCCON 0056]|uniref:type II toxin-antitoxin system HicB family antitoxin n=1 Tax=Megasphaera sp. WILCCON 0056 TaxID=3345340 RepID=UPI003A80C3DE
MTFSDLPGCISWGQDVPQVIEAAQTALTLHLSGMRQDKLSLPPATPVSLCKEREPVKDDEAIYIIYES